MRPSAPTAFLDPSRPAEFGTFFQSLGANHTVTRLDLAVPWETRVQAAARAVELDAAYQ